jgi:hypothetical protein
MNAGPSETSADWQQRCEALQQALAQLQARHAELQRRLLEQHSLPADSADAQLLEHTARAFRVLTAQPSRTPAFLNAAYRAALEGGGGLVPGDEPHCTEDQLPALVVWARERQARAWFLCAWVRQHCQVAAPAAAGVETAAVTKE